jgi:hypothetical protein
MRSDQEPAPPILHCRRQFALARVPDAVRRALFHLPRNLSTLDRVDDVIAVDDYLVRCPETVIACFSPTPVPDHVAYP